MIRTKSSSFWLLAVAALAAQVACGGAGAGSPGASHPGDPPPLDDAPAGSAPAAVVPASSAKVQAGMDAIQAGDFAKAKAALEEAVKANPKDPQAEFYLGVALQGLDDKTGAEEHYKKALSLDPKLSDAAVNLSALMLDAGDAQGALKIVKDGLAAVPKHPGLVMNLALALEATGDKDGALAAYAEVCALMPDNAELHYAFAELLFDAGRKEEAGAELKKVATDDPRVLIATANLFGRLEVFADCVAVLDKVIKAKATQDAHTRRGACRHGMKDEPGAQKDYLAAIALDPKFAPAHFYLGQSYRGEGKKKEAQAEFEAAIKIDGDKGVGKHAKKALDDMLGGKK